MNRKYGYINKHRPPHLLQYSLIKPKGIILPSSVDLRTKCPSVADQGQLGDCTANALVEAVAFIRSGFWGSRLFVYYNERSIENDTQDDSGADLSDGIQALNTQGICLESQWPYNIGQFAVKPTSQCYIDAIPNTISEYHQLETLDDMQSCLAEGFPFVFGFQVYESFDSDVVASSGIVPMPEQSEQCVGGHAVMAVGYDTQGRFIVQNSWGKLWGDNGFFYIPFEYLSDDNLTSDRWTIRQ